MQTNELVEVVEQSGLEQQTSSYLKEKFLPFFEQAQKWKSEAKKLIVTDVSQKKEMMLAREARLALRDIRIQADKTRKALKEDSLRYGKAVQGVYNVIEYLVVPIEKYLEEQEKFEEIQEQKRKDALKALRDEEIKDLVEFIPYGLDLGEMSDENYQKLIDGARLQYAKKFEAERKAEQERIAEEKRKEEERIQMALENERLKKEAEKREKELKAIQEQQRLEREKLEQELKAQQEKERLERERILAEETNKKKLEEQKRLAPDKEKLLELSKTISLLELPQLNSAEANHILENVKGLISKLSQYIVEKSQNL